MDAIAVEFAAVVESVDDRFDLRTAQLRWC